VFLDDSTTAQWLDPALPASATAIESLLEVFESAAYRETFVDRVASHAVSRKMSTMDYQGADCSVPIKVKTTPNLTSFFSVAKKVVTPGAGGGNNNSNTNNSNSSSAGKRKHDDDTTAAASDHHVQTTKKAHKETPISNFFAPSPKKELQDK
jgi:hypothetical protein